MSSGIEPSILEYIDVLAMAGITNSAGLDLGVPETSRRRPGLPGRGARRHAGEPGRRGRRAAGHACSPTLGALDVFVLPSTAGAQLISAREKAFFVAKAAGADDIVDAVVPRAAIPDYLARWPNWPATTAPSSPAAATWVTATSTSPSSSRTRHRATH